MSKLLSCMRGVCCICVSLVASCATDPVTPEEATSSDDGSLTESAVPHVTCSGPSTVTGFYANGRRQTNPVTVSCSGVASRIRVFGSLSILGVVKDSKDVTCTNASSCTMPSMSAVANQNDQWSAGYAFNWTN